MFIFATFTTDLNLVILLFFSLGILASATVEIYRISLLNEEKVISAILLDLSIVVSQIMMIICLILVGKTIDLVLVIWAISFLLAMSVVTIMKGIPRNFLKIPELLLSNTKAVFILSLVPVLALMHSSALNIILMLSVGSEGLGVFKSVQLFFIPLNFLLNFQTIVYLPHIANGRNDQAFLVKRNLLSTMTVVFLLSSISANIYLNSILLDIKLIILIGLFSLIPAISNLDFLRLIATSYFRLLIFSRMAWLFCTVCSLIAVISYQSLTISVLTLCGIELLLFMFQSVSLRGKHRCSI